MSRIGRMPIAIPAGVTVTLDGNVITVKGAKETLTREIHPNMHVAVENNEIIVTRPNDEKQNRALHGLTRSLIHNMVVGVTEGFKKELEVNGVGYRVAKQGKDLVMNLGFSHQVTMSEIPGITIEVPGPNKIIISVCSGSPREASAGAVQGQGHQVRRRAHPPQGRQDRRQEEVRKESVLKWFLRRILTRRA